MANEISLLPIFLFMIVFYWTPPHFWALALMRKKDMPQPACPCCPWSPVNARPMSDCALQRALFLISLAPFFLGLMGPIHAVARARALSGSS